MPCRRLVTPRSREWIRPNLTLSKHASLSGPHESAVKRRLDRFTRLCATHPSRRRINSSDLDPI